MPACGRQRHSESRVPLQARSQSIYRVDSEGASISGARDRRKPSAVNPSGIPACDGVGVVFCEVIRSVNHQSPITPQPQTSRRSVDDVGIRAHSHRDSPSHAVAALRGIRHCETRGTRHILRVDSEGAVAAGVGYRLQLHGVNAGGVPAGDRVVARVGFNSIGRHIND